LADTPSSPARQEIDAEMANTTRATDGLAIAALVMGIVSFVCSIACLGVVFGPAAAIAGFISRRRIRSSAGTLGGGGIASSGLVLGVIGLITSVTWLVLLLSDASFRQFLKAP
jgi:hypothetical protein